MAKTLKFICNLEALLIERGLSQADLCQGSGLSTTTSGKLTGGGRIQRIDVGSSEKILNYLGCEFDHLWTIVFDDAV